jgi:hypothetical protein
VQTKQGHGSCWCWSGAAESLPSESGAPNGQLGLFQRPPGSVYRLVQCFDHQFRPSLPKKWTLSQVFVQRNIMCRNWAGFIRQFVALDFLVC